ncbi:DUF6678 family protein [Niallia circulans]
MDEKQKVVTVVNKKQLASVMNNTKWEQLQKCVIDTLPFTPPYQVKYVLEDAPYPETLIEDVYKCQHKYVHFRSFKDVQNHSFSCTK